MQESNERLAHFVVILKANDGFGCIDVARLKLLQQVDGVFLVGVFLIRIEKVDLGM